MRTQHQSQDEIEHQRKVSESRITVRLRLADGAAWSDTVARCSVLPSLLADLVKRAGRSLGEVQGNVALFRKWKAGEFTPVDLDKRLVVINLGAHHDMVERVMRRDGIEEPVSADVRD